MSQSELCGRGIERIDAVSIDMELRGVTATVLEQLMGSCVDAPCVASGDLTICRRSGAVMCPAC